MPAVIAAEKDVPLNHACFPPFAVVHIWTPGAKISAPCVGAQCGLFLLLSTVLTTNRLECFDFLINGS